MGFVRGKLRFPPEQENRDPAGIPRNTWLASEAKGQTELLVGWGREGESSYSWNPSRLPSSPQGSPVMQEPDILRLKANVSGAQTEPRLPPRLRGGRASHRGEKPPQHTHTALQEPTVPLLELQFLVRQKGQ